MQPQRLRAGPHCGETGSIINKDSVDWQRAARERASRWLRGEVPHEVWVKDAAIWMRKTIESVLKKNRGQR